MKTKKIYLVPTRVTERFILENYRVVKVQYCDAANLLRYYSPIHYCIGAMGKNSDCYAVYIDGGLPVIVSTGYRPIGEQTPTETLKNFERKSKEYRGENKEEFNDGLLIKLIKETLNKR